MPVIRCALLLCALAVASCAPAAPSSSSQAGDTAPRVTKRITVAVQENVSLLWGSGADVISELYLAGLVALDPNHMPQAQLATAVPSLENGLWKLLPDGRMEMTWTLRPDVRWHDGTPMTAQDVVFSAQIPNEFPDLQLRSSSINQAIESIQARDDRTVVATWKTPHARADWLFSHQLALPFARHVVEKSYQESKDQFTNLRYWSTEMVGSGPYVVREFVPKSHLKLTAFDGYTLGRPKIDEIDLRFIDDPNTMTANILAGQIDLSLGTGLTVSRAKQIEQDWKDGTLIYGPPGSSYAAYPQFIDSDPAILANNVQLRRALAHGIDRQELLNTFQSGIGTVAHLLIADRGPDYEAVRGRVERYGFDPRRAAQLIDQLGFTRSGDGLFHDAAGKELSVPVWSSQDTSDLALSAQDYWRRIGVGGQPYVVPSSADRSVMPTRPGVQMAKLQSTLDTRFMSSEAPTQANGYRGSNRSRYQSPELDNLLTGYFAEVRPAEQRRLLGDINKHLIENVVVIPIFYDVVPQVTTKRMQNVIPRATLSQAWDSHLWDVS